jgi:hypothetical protein
MTYKVHDVLTRNIAILRARAERYRRLANDLFDPGTSQEAANLAEELDAEIARLQGEPDTARRDLNTNSSAQFDGQPTIFSS